MHRDMNLKFVHNHLDKAEIWILVRQNTDTLLKDFSSMKGCVYDPKNATPTVKYGGGNIMKHVTEANINRKI